MTKEQARIIILEAELRQAQDTVEFLHGCLTDKKHYKYGFPHQTLARLEKWNKIAPRSKYCPHSVTVIDCEECAQRNKEIGDYQIATQILKS